MIKPIGIVIHSTATPGVMAADWFGRWNKSYKAGEIDRQVCTHAFVDDEECWQYLPWNYRGWHVGGAGNDTHIGIELCEPKDWATNKKYFDKVYANAVELCVLLVKMYNIPVENIIDHAQAYRMGLGSNHVDVGHWFPKFGKNMDMFREDVRKALTPVVSKPTTSPVSRSGQVEYTVVSGDTLSGIGQKFSVDWQKIAQANKITNPNLIRVGQKLVIPTSRPAEPTEMTGTVKVNSTLNVRSGAGTKYKIIGSLKNGAKVTVLDKSGSWYKIKYGNTIGYVSEQYLEVSGVSKAPAQYVVKRGDTLSEIAKKNGYTVAELAKFNGIKNPSMIRVGQVIKFPDK
jgi:LysM repeat protein